MKKQNWVALDGLRGISIILVVLVHLWAHSTRSGTGLPVIISIGKNSLDATWIFSTGHNAVITFFTLSGFLLYSHWLAQASTNQGSLQRIQEFYKRRFHRIAPAFIFFLTAYLILTSLVGRHHFSADLHPANFLLNISFLSPISGFLKGPATSLDIIPGTWSLNPEIWFYIAMPILASLIGHKKYDWVILALISTLGPIYRSTLDAATPFNIRFSIFGVADAFLIGMATASLARFFLTFAAAKHLTPVGIALYLACCMDSSPLHIDEAYQLSLASALMIAGLVAPGNTLPQRFFSLPSIVRVGQISYSMFLCNIIVAWYITLPITQFAGIRSDSSLFFTSILVGLSLTLYLSSISYELIEKPFLGKQPQGASLRKAGVLRLLMVLLAASIIPSAANYIAKDGLGAEYKGPAVKAINAIFSHSFGGLHVRTISTTEFTSIDTESKASFITLNRTSARSIELTSTQHDPFNKWISINLPFDAKESKAGHQIRATATVSIQKGSADRICLGIFNGLSDVCSEIATLERNRDLTVETTIANAHIVQFKLNIFPALDGGPFKATIKDIKIIQEM